jgi:predicted nucleotidyltransferase
MKNPRQIKSKLRQLVAVQKPRDTIIAAYAFGSCLREDFKDRSDIDLAFLIPHAVYREDPLKAIAPAHILAAEIGLALDRETDVTILNSASLEMAFEIITHGECIYESDSEDRIQHELKVKGMYYDFKPFIDDLRAKRLKGLSSHRGRV